MAFNLEFGRSLSHWLLKIKNLYEFLGEHRLQGWPSYPELHELPVQGRVCPDVSGQRQSSHDLWADQAHR